MGNRVRYLKPRPTHGTTSNFQRNRHPAAIPFIIISLPFQVPSTVCRSPSQEPRYRKKVLLSKALPFHSSSSHCHSRHHQPSAVLIPSSYSRSPSLTLLFPFVILVIWVLFVFTMNAFHNFHPDVFYNSNELQRVLRLFLPLLLGFALFQRIQ